jgi:hypothetical protein
MDEKLTCGGIHIHNEVPYKRAGLNEYLEKKKKLILYLVQNGMPKLDFPIVFRLVHLSLEEILSILTIFLQLLCN